MKILTHNFYKFFFGFIGVILVSLVLIFIAGALSSSDDVSPEANLAGECPEDVSEC